VKSPLPNPVRDLIALIVIVIACPVAVFGGANVGCVGHTEFTGTCAVTVVFVSPLVLLIGGLISGLATHGWTGLLVVLVGMVIGMTAILFLSQFAGRPVPLDIYSAIAATFFFGVPIVAGYGIGRLVSRVFLARAG
jgi:hypothetical protein